VSYTSVGAIGSATSTGFTRTQLCMYVCLTAVISESRLTCGCQTHSGVALAFADGTESADPVPAAGLLPPAAPLVGPVGGPANSRNNNYGLHPILRTLAVPLSELGTAEQLR
jgi:hypothetical protein